MELLDWIIGWFFSPQILTWLWCITRRDVFSFLRHILKNGHSWSTKVISGPDFLEK